MNIKKVSLVLVLLVGAAISITTAKAEPPQSSPLLNDLSRYDSSFIQSVGDFILKQGCRLDIVKTKKPLYMPVDDAFIRRVGLDDAAKIHINNIVKKAIGYGYELHFCREKYPQITMNNSPLEYQSTQDALQIVNKLLTAIN